MIVLINLQSAEVRRARMTAQLENQGIPFDRLGHDFRGRDRSEIARLLARPPIAITVPLDHFLGGRGGPVKPRIGVLQPACVHEDPRTARVSQIQPHTWRPDRSRVIEGARRRFLDSRASDWFYRIYRWL